MRERVAVRRQTLPDGPATGYGLAPARRPLGRRFALLVVLACAGVLALGTASAQAMPASGGSSRSSSADPPAPTVDSQSTSNVGSQTAQLDAQINPQGADTTCKFQYVDDSDFMSTGFTGPDVVTVPCDPQNLGSATSDVSALANISGLQPNTLYDFQAVAHSTGGTIDGGATQFSTGPAASIDSESASNVGPQTAELDAEINPEGNDTTCEFQYVDDTDFMSSGFTGPNVVTVACNPQDLGAGIGDASTLADISGLTPNTTYDFRAVATNSLAPSGLDGSPTQFTTTPAVSVDAESATNITDTDATLNAQLNPEGLDTTYQFEYVTDADYSACSCYTNATTVPATPVDIGSGTTDQAATVGLTGLTPGTKYHYQVVATNSAGTSDGSAQQGDQTFTTYPSSQATGLPDDRGYEQVTPANKDDGEPYLRAGQIFGPTVASSTGNSLSWFSLDALPGSQFDGSFYVSNRGANSWSTTALISPQGTQNSLLCALIASEAVGFSQDLSQAVISDGANQPTCGPDTPPLVSGEPSGAQNLFVVAAGQAPRLVDPTPIGGATPADANFDGASADLSTVVFDEPAQLTSNAPGSGDDDLYASSPSTGPSPSVALVTVLPDGTPVNGSLADGSAGDAFNAVSDDGSKVFFTATPSTTTNLYVRENPLSSSASTVQVDSGIGGGANFLAATPDGNEVFFTDSSNGHLYEYDLQTNALSDLTPTGSAAIDGLAGISDDGSTLYFVANSVLASNANSQGQTAASNEPTPNQNPNLYKLDIASGTITFIAPLNGSDGNDWSPTSLSARVSANGSFVAFTTVNELNTSTFTNTGPPQIYVADGAAATPTVNCASCAPGGAGAVAGATINPPYRPIDFASGEFLQRYVSDSGQLFFDTPDALLPAVQNNGVSDVYEWEGNGTGSCASGADNGGCLYLLSGGASSSPSYFANASPSGNDVFFSTWNQLVPQDTDTAADFYDARVGGGFPPTAPPPSCVGDSCKPPQTEQQPPPTVATVTFVGPGNVTSSSSKNHKKKKKHKKHTTIAVLTHRITGDRVKIGVTVPAGGRLSVAGADLSGSSRYVRRAGAYTLLARLRPGAMAALERKHKLKLAIRVRYAPSGGAASAAVIELTVKA